MRRSTSRLLKALADLYPCVILSGRIQADAEARLDGVGVRAVIGHHGVDPRKTASSLLIGNRGVEPASVMGGYVKEVARWLPHLEESLAAYRGVTLENKGASVALHYRKSREKARARGAILQAAAGLGDVRIISGKLVVNVLPRGAPHKGVALERERSRLRCDTAIYVGDDESDEDVFALDQPGRLLTIRVGPKAKSLASYCIKNQAELDDLLRVLVHLRRAPDQRKQAM